MAKNYRNNTMLNLKTRHIWEKKKHKIISEMFWCNILQKEGPDYDVNDFPGTSVDFSFKKFTRNN